MFALTGRALQLLSYEVRGLHTAVYVIALSSLLSSLLALLRDRLLAHAFGASATLDIYYAAFRIPDLIFVGAGALVSVYILIPELTRRSSQEQREYIDTVLVGFSLIAVAASILAVLLAPAILATLFPEITAAGNGATLVGLTRLMLLQPIFLGLSNIFGAITQVRQRYALYALSPLLYNIGIISGVVFFYPMWGMLGLALSLNQITFIGLVALAATLTPGSIAVYMLASNLQAVPLAIIGASYSVAAFPILAAAFARGERDLFIEHIATAARLVVFWSLPALALIIVLRAYIVRAILGSGAFDWNDTRLTAAVLGLLSLSLAAQGIAFLLVRGYYASGRTFVPFFVSLLTATATVGLGALLIGVFQNPLIADLAQSILRVVNVPGSSVLALALAHTVVSILGAIVLVIHFERRFGGFLSRVWGGWVQSAIASLAAGLGAYGLLVVIGPITLASTTLSVITKGFAAGMFGLIVAGLTYALLGSREFAEILEAIRGRMRGIKVLVPQSAVVSAEEGGPTTPQ